VIISEITLNDLKDYIKNEPEWGKKLSHSKNPKLLEYKTLIENFTSFLPKNTRMAIRGWHIKNDIYHIPKCATCEKLTKYDFNLHNYRQYCGNDCANSSPLTVQRREATMQERYDGAKTSMQSATIRQTIMESNRRVWGVDWAVSAPKNREKAKQTMGKNHGVTFGRQKHMTTILPYLLDKEYLIDEHHRKEKTLVTIANELGIDGSTVSDYLIKHGIEIKYFYSSTAEKEIGEWLTSQDINFTSRTRNIIKGELDIYIPNCNLAIEYNGLYWHSDTQKPDRNYHANKLKQCQEKGIRLISIYENEWDDRKDIVLAKLANILNINNSKPIYARKCSIIFPTTKQKREFYNKFHIQGDGPSSVNIGLEYNGKLVACMGFIHKQKENYYELNRFATSCKVTGGFSKLLKYFENVYENPKIVSFADLRWSQGNVYYKNGFTLNKTLPPDYMWSKNSKLWHKFGFRHKWMKQKLKNYDDTKTENQNMKAHGFHRIWDCGKLRFIKN
jgi:hypothetical protein